jgi:hypothetical protein
MCEVATTPPWSQNRCARLRMDCRRGTRHGLIRPSFILASPVRVLRDLMRYRKSLVYQHTQEINRLHKVLEDGQYQTDKRGIGRVGQKRTEHDQSDHPGRKRCAGPH